MAEAAAPRARRGGRNHRAGLAGEDAAARFYESRGAEVLARRWRAPEGEIDLIVRDGGVIAFVEVKSGRGALRRDAIGPRQWARLEAAAVRYMLHAETGDAPVRFDAAFVGPDGAVDVVENARMSEAW
ncbi:YraN family protein [Rubrimonas cliftonensis]|uniref:UPF0102 protein SAMN05444370_10282 n=1 Tax=Rubrimonas cliftonensis TaxID=89524 RepID=A0A1H3WQW5_9RHOB|nr:YraN family protein [Rubrimonas cliftonensis]SDZ89535.1 putative endonuclease [Rubrimonas cliftonensis]